MGYGTLLNVMLRFFKYLDSFLSVHYTINLLILNLKRLYDTRPRGTRWVPSPQRAVAGAFGVQRHTHTFSPLHLLLLPRFETNCLSHLFA